MTDMQSQPARDENLLCYLLDALDEREKLEVETLLQSDEVARTRLEQLRHVLEPLAADKEEIAAPAGLVARTVGFVAQHCCREIPRAPTPPPAVGGSRSWWRRADVLVAASLLILAVGLGIPALLNLRGSASPAAVAECSDNLRNYYVALQSYKDTHGNYPNVANLANDRSRNVAGMVVPVLNTAGVLPQAASIRCPGNGKPLPASTTLDEAESMPLEEFLRRAKSLSACYAYSLGWKDASGNYHGPEASEELPESLLALMSDCPPDNVYSNSLNHSGRGQNVLFGAGNVKFFTLRNAGYAGDDIFRNKDGKIAAGNDCFDTVLGHSAAKP